MRAQTTKIREYTTYSKVDNKQMQINFIDTPGYDQDIKIGNWIKGIKTYIKKRLVENKIKR